MNSCNILILNKKNQFLLQLRDKNKNIKSPNHWCLFGGLKKKDETYIQCINREVKEELNITISKILKNNDYIAIKGSNKMNLSTTIDKIKKTFMS